MVVMGPRLSEGTAAPVMPRRPRPAPVFDDQRTAAKARANPVSNPVVRQPVQQTYRPPAPVYQPPYQAPYVPPYQPPYQPPQQFYQPYIPQQQQSFQNFEPPAPPPPPPPPKPPVGGREWYMGLDKAGRAAQDAKFLGGDSDYASQIGEYDRALSAFVDRIAKQKKLFEDDERVGIEATTKNEGMTLNNLGEDFGARGLSYSGMFDQSKEQTSDRFRETRGNITKNRVRNVTDASNREKDYRGENQVGRGNARRAALQRMAAEQALKDASAGF